MATVDRYPIAEIFGPTIQGEGPDVGQLCHFVRIGGCDYRCSWCDSMHAVEPESVRQLPRLSASQIVHELRTLSGDRVRYVVLTGGNPALYDLSNLILGIHAMGAKVSMETQGTVWNDCIKDVDRLIVSPKPPSSGMPDVIDDRLPRFLDSLNGMRVKSATALKVVVFDDDDLLWAAKVHRSFHEYPFFLSVGTTPEMAGNVQLLLAKTRDLIASASAISTLADVKVLPQLHVALWGSELGR